MSTDGIPDWLRRWGLEAWLLLGIVAVAVLLGLLLSITRTVTLPLLLGAYFAVVFHPVVEWLSAHRVPRPLAALSVLLGIFAIVIGVGALIGTTLSEEWPDLREQIDDAVTDVQEWIDDANIDPQLIERARDAVSSSGGTTRDGIGPRVVAAANSAVSILGGLVLGIIVLYYLLKDGRQISDSLSRSAQRRGREDVDELLDYASTSIRRYYMSRSVLALLNGVSIAAGMAIIGVPGALAIGVVNFVGGYIPYFGAFVGGAFAVLLAVSEGGIGLAIVALAIVLGSQVLLENLLEPKLVSGFVALPPLLVLLVTTLGGVLFGIVGLILATPTTVITLQAVRTLRFDAPVPILPKEAFDLDGDGREVDGEDDGDRSVSSEEGSTD